MPAIEGLDDYSARHVAQRSALDADQAEFAALRDCSANAYHGIYDDLVADALDDFDSAGTLAQLDAPEWNLQDLQQDDAVGSLLERAAERQELLKDHYPFKFAGNAIAYTGSKTGVYEFCLAVCQTSFASGESVKMPRVFEQLAHLLVRNYLSAGACSHHTGWPRQAAAQLRFKAAMAPLFEKTREWRWCPEEGLPDDPAPANVKDEGVDFIVWQPSPDGRIGHLFLLGQCACGENWDQKFSDIDLARLSKWFNPMTLVPPVRVFCTPYHVTDALLKEATRQAGIVFDRMRLTLLAETCGATVADEIARLSLSDFLPESPNIRQR